MYVCLDCRAYVDNYRNVYSKPLKCGYDPYSGVWSDWKVDPLKESAISYYNLKDINS